MQKRRGLSGSRAFKSRKRRLALRSGVPDNSVRHIGRFQLRDLGSFSLSVESRGRVIEMLRLRGADDGCGHERLLGQPREGDLRLRHAAGGGDGGDLIDDPPIGCLGVDV